MLANALDRYQSRINQQLSNEISALEDIDDKLKSAMAHGALKGGKRVRPFLIYALGDMLQLDLAKLDNCAAAIECMHAYSLIHDDLPAMDDDDLRRGQPTVHIAFDEATAILAGDALQSLAFELICKPVAGIDATQQLAMVSALAKASGYHGMCGGQAMDLNATDKQIDLATLMQLHQLKTGALIRCCIEFVTITAKINQQEAQALLDFSNAIGLAFQVQDDVLDIISSTEELGKPQGSDLDSNKSTYPKLLGLTGAQETAHRLIEDALSALAKLPYNSQLIAAFARYIIERRV